MHANFDEVAKIVLKITLALSSTAYIYIYAVLDNARVIFRTIFATSSKLACIGDPPQGNSLVYMVCKYA